MIYAICIAILSAAFIALYLLDRGIANTLEAIALRLLSMADRLRSRREDIAIEQSQRLAAMVNGPAHVESERAMAATSVGI